MINIFKLIEIIFQNKQNQDKAKQNIAEQQMKLNLKNDYVIP